ncbi:hypothetical protein BCS42_13005 [Crenothrix sp. D3]|nr:hypothetical protein BCS42_13005 [Crenothrix sp. D3]
MTDKTADIYQQLTEKLRAKAEKKLESLESLPSIIPANELLHELYVHQIELEMQNEELRQAQVALEESHDRYIDLYEFAPVGYLTLNTSCMVIEANLAAVTLLGVERAKLLKHHFATYIVPEDKERWHHYFVRSKQQTGKQSIELTLSSTHGTRLVVQIDSLLIKKDYDQSTLRITLTDITPRKQAEKQLRVAAVAFKTQAGILITDEKKLVIKTNRAFTQITGYSTEEIIGHSLSFLNSGLYNENFYKNIWASIASDGYWQGEIWDTHKNGEIFPVWLTIANVTDNNGFTTHYVGSFTDITVQKEAEKLLLDDHQKLEHLVADTQEELEKVKDDSIRTNTALDVLLKYRETDKCDAQSTLSYNVEKTVFPFLAKLRKQIFHKDHVYLLDVIQSNLHQLVLSYGRDSRLASIYQKLTPAEIQVSSMIRQGLSTKTIAATLQLSPGTIGIHRKHIRKKLGLNGSNDSLYGYLLSLDE